MIETVELKELVKLKDQTPTTTRPRRRWWVPGFRFAWGILADDDYLAEAKRYFKDQIVVDLGCGTDISMYRVCCISESRAYVGVDKKSAKLVKNLNSERAWKKYDRNVIRLDHTIEPKLSHPRKVPASYANDDILSFLRKLPNDSVSVSACGIDASIEPNSERVPQIESEIERVLNPEGAYISLASRFFYRVLDYKPEETSLNLEKWNSQFHFTVARKN